MPRRKRARSQRAWCPFGYSALASVISSDLLFVYHFARVCELTILSHAVPWIQHLTSLGFHRKYVSGHFTCFEFLCPGTRPFRKMKHYQHSQFPP